MASAPDTVAFILACEPRVIPRGGQVTRDDALSLIRSAVQRRPATGITLWPHIADHPDLQAAVVSAWGRADRPADLDTILAVLVDADLRILGHAAGQFLSAASRNADAPWEKTSRFDTFIQRMWDACETDETFATNLERDWLTTTINTPVGHLIDFWFEMFRRRWAATVDDGPGLSLDDKAFLDKVLADTTLRGAYALTQISSRLHLLDAADSGWCRSRLIPLGAWDEPLVAEPYWWGCSASRA